MCYVIAAGLFEESQKADRTKFFYLSVQTLVHCLAMFDRIMMENNETVSSKVPSLQRVMNDATSKVLSWMEIWKPYLGSNMEEKLMVTKMNIFLFKNLSPY